MRVDLPAPFSPTRAWTSPGRSSNETPRSARTPAKDLLTLVNRSRGAMAQPRGRSRTAEASAVDRPAPQRPPVQPLLHRVGGDDEAVEAQGHPGQPADQDRQKEDAVPDESQPDEEQDQQA